MAYKKKSEQRTLNKAETDAVINSYFAGHEPEAIASYYDIPLETVISVVGGLRRPTPEPMAHVTDASVIKAALAEQRKSHKGTTVMTEQLAMMIEDNKKLGVYDGPKRDDSSYIFLIDPDEGRR